MAERWTLERAHLSMSCWIPGLCGLSVSYSTGRLRWDAHSGSYCITRFFGHTMKIEAFWCQLPSKMDIAAVCVYADGPVGTDKPNTAPDLRLILGGKFLDNNEMLNGAPALSPFMIAHCQQIDRQLSWDSYLSTSQKMAWAMQPLPPCTPGKCFPCIKRIQEVIDKI